MTQMLPDGRTFILEHAPRYGTANPSRMNLPFWRHMVRTAQYAHLARVQFAPPAAGESSPDPYRHAPVWCFQRYGPTRTVLPDGRIVCIGGEHEDFYDPDFVIYNDVIVIDPSASPEASIGIFGYPRDVFPPTDFHTATLVGDRIIIVGGLGYQGERGGGETPVFALDVMTFSITRLATQGQSPGWIFEHRAELLDDGRTIRVHGGKRILGRGNEESHVPFTSAADLCTRSLAWTPASPPPDDTPTVEWPAGWTPLEASMARHTTNTLRDALPLSHPLFHANVRALADEDGGSRVLFQLLDGTRRVAVVTLTFSISGRREPDSTTLYDSLESWLAAIT